MDAGLNDEKRKENKKKRRKNKKNAISAPTVESPAVGTTKSPTVVGSII